MTETHTSNGEKRELIGIRFVKWVLGLLIASLGLVISVVITQKISEISTVSTNCEYMSTWGKAIEFKPNLEKIAKVVIPGKEIDKLHTLTLLFYNRTNKNLSDIEFTIELVDQELEKLDVVHSVIFCPDGLKPNYVNVKEENSEITYKVPKFNSSWDDSQIIMVNVFVNTDKRPGVKISSPNAGLNFIPYDFTIKRWYLFGYDRAFEIGIFLIMFIILSIVVIYSINHYELEKDRTFNRVINRSLEYYVLNNHKIDYNTMLATIHFAMLQTKFRISLKESKDLILKHERVIKYLQDHNIEHLSESDKIREDEPQNPQKIGPMA